MFECIIEYLNTASRHPLVITTVGGLVIKIILDKRSDRLKKQNEGVAFVTENASLINKIFPLLFEWIRYQNPENEINVRNEIRLLFENRFSVRVKSRVLLGESDFATKYDIFCWQLHSVVEVLRDASNSTYSDNNNKEMNPALVEKVIREHQTLTQRWPLKRDAFHKITLSDTDQINGWEHMHSWLMSLWFRGLSLHMKALKYFVN